jgi:hypothetical protein
VSLLLDGGSELEEVLGHRLVGTSEDVDKAVECKSVVGVRGYIYLRARVRLVLHCEEGDGLASLASSASSSNTVDVIFDGQGELELLEPLAEV